MPAEVHIIRRHEEVLVIAAYSHQAQELVIALDRFSQETLAGKGLARDLPQESSLTQGRREQRFE